MLSKCRYDVVAVAAAALAVVFTLHGQTPVEVGARLKAAAARNSLANADTIPWHLKLDITVFDDAGKNPQVGTIEMWRSGDNRRIVYDFGGSRYTRLELHDASYQSAGKVDLPYRATRILDAVLHMGPSVSSVDESLPELRKQSFGKVSLDCVMLSRPDRHSLPQAHPKPFVETVPLGLFPTYCLAPGTDDILLRYNLGGELLHYKTLGKFEEHEVPLQIEMADGPITLASASITSLRTYTPAADEFVPTPDLKEVGARSRVAASVIAGHKISGPVPVYPESAKQDRVSGTVILRALIGTDGRIHSLEPVQSPGLSLTLSAIQAVRKWRYQPYLLNGEPTEVDTTITVNFNLNGG